jgi:hypothetical protein
MNISAQNNKSDKFFQLMIVLFILIPHLLIVFSHQNILIDWFNTDDAFYYYKTAQNVVDGKGFTFDGFGRTNGFQPLWMLVLLPVFFIIRNDLITPLRVVIGLQTLLSLGAALILYRLFQKNCSKPVSFLMALGWSMLPAIHDLTNQGGMESGLNTFFIIVFWSQANQVIEHFSESKKPLRWILGLSGLAVLTLFSRLDNVFFVYLMGAWVILRLWKRPDEKRVFSWKRLIELGSAYFAPLTLALGGYMLINKVYFGSFMPVSGTIKRWWGTLDYTVYGYPPKDLQAWLGELFSENGNIGPFSGIVKIVQSLKEWISNSWSYDFLSGQAVFGILIVFFLLLIGLIIYFQRDFVKKIFWKWSLVPIFVSCAFHIAYYKGIGQVAQKQWYWIIENFLVFLIAAILIEGLFRILSQWNYGRVAAISLVVLLTIGIMEPHVGRIKRVLDYSPMGDEHLYLKSVHWLEAHTEPGSIIGMTGAGSTGYFIKDRIIVNLDGLINSVEYFVHLQNATADQYFASIGGDYIFGNAYILQDTNPYLWNFDQRLEFLLTYEKVDQYRHWALFRFK